MDLSALNSTLPPGLADVEREMGEKFRASALSITTLYKASLSATKQAYHSGYSSCLSDVLSTVQSSIASGQDASQTLSRLMDWVESREAAMVAFAADDTEEPSSAASTSTPAPMPPRRSAQTRHALSRLQHQAQRPSSEPAPDHPPPPHLSHTASTGHSTPISSAQPSWQPTPAPYASSSPTTSASASVPRPVLLHASSSRKHHHSPVRSSHRVEQAMMGHPPSSSFEPVLPPLPTAGAPFITSSTTTNVPIGSKRPLIDIEMGEDTGSPPPRSTAPRASKRRSLGNHLAKGEEGNDAEKDRDRRRGGRRGHGGGAGGGGGVGTAGN